MSQHSQTFSELWYRVADFAPRLSPHLVVKRHTIRHETWFIIGDPASSKFYRFNAAAYRFLGLLDGKRTVQEAWDVCNAQLGDAAPTQRDCIDLLGQLQMFGLLRGDLPIDAHRLRDRMEKLKEQKWQERTGKYVFWTVPLLNPERFLSRFANIARVVFSGWGLGALLVLLFLAFRAVLPRTEELTGSFNSLIAPENLIWISLCFIVLKVIHEFAHGFACKAYGGRVTEMGLFFLIVLPLPYCDATSSWAFPNKWHRILVSSAGVIVEVAIACVAAMVWAATEPGLVHTLAYNVMIVASVATVVFNLNPLLRYDGYYVLVDLLEIPNLASRSQELMKWGARRYLFGLKGEPAPALHSRNEGAWMATHATLAFPYRLLVMLGIVLVVAQQYFLIGLILGLFGFIVWFVAPIMKGLGYVLSEPTLQLVRARAMAVTFGALLLAILLIGVVPMPARIYATAVVEPYRQHTFRAPLEGVLNLGPVRDGMLVNAGTPIAVIDNPMAELQWERARAAVRIEQIRVDAMQLDTPTKRKLAEMTLQSAREGFELAEAVRRDLTLTAPFTGLFIGPELPPRAGTWINQGDPIARLATLDHLVVRAYVDDADYAWLFRDRDRDEAPIAEARFYGLPGITAPLVLDRDAVAGVRTIEHQAVGMGTEGGTVAVDPTDPRGQRALSPQWVLTLRFPDDPDSQIAAADSAHGRPTRSSLPSASAALQTGLGGGRAPGAAPVESEISQAKIHEDEASSINHGTDRLMRPSVLEGGRVLPGTRARVRFSLDPEPLASQWWRRLRQEFAARFAQ